MAEKQYSLLNIARDRMAGTVTYATTETANARMSVCKKCPKFAPMMSVCQSSGRYLHTKVKFERSTCPLAHSSP